MHYLRRHLENINCSSIGLVRKKIDTDAVLINGKSYIVGVCDATEVDSVKIDFTDPDTKKIVESKKVDLQGKKLFVVPSPDVKSYMVTVHSNDKEG